MHEPLGPTHLSVLDLHPSGTRARRRLAIDAVVQLGGRPVLYVVRGPLPPNALSSLRHELVQRGAADHLGILEPGTLRVLPLLPRSTGVGRRSRAVRRDDAGAAGTIPSLAFGALSADARGTGRHVHKALFALLVESTKRLVQSGVSPDDALSLVGRALFFRFLVDRQIVTMRHLASISPGATTFDEALRDRDGIEAVSAWLDDTFNGNLLPLGSGWDGLFGGVRRTAAIVQQLTRIVSRTDARGQKSFAWATLDFGHVPVGLLSEVYESWSHAYEGSRARRESAFYTPGAVAEFIVDEALRGTAEPHRARVLDPSAGAGVFLVAAYRALIKARWLHDQKRPERDVLRDVLVHQLTGFEVNGPALRLSALALYLTALELDPNPGPPSRLRFPDLIRTGVLWDARSDRDRSLEARKVPPVGSLGAHVPSHHDGRYDLLVGNPPWTAWKSEARKDQHEVEANRSDVERALTPTVQARVGVDRSFVMIENEPDLAFFWRALTWAKPGAMVALALHARVLFRTTSAGIAARNDLLRATQVTGVVNGAALRQTCVWPQHEAPFCVVFAKNRRPTDADGWVFVSPEIDAGLNDAGHVRIDASAARPVFTPEVERHPWWLKALFRGGPLGAALVDRLAARPVTPTGAEGIAPRSQRLDDWWPTDFTSLGFAKGKTSKQRSCVELVGRRMLESGAEVGVSLDHSKLDEFAYKTVTEPRTGHWKKAHPAEAAAGLAPRVFRGPLVVMKQSPPVSPRLPRAHAARGDVVYDNSYFGFSAAWHPDADRVANYLLVWLSSRVSLFMLLLRAPGFGVERERLLLEDLRALPIPPWNSLSHEDRSAFDDVAAKLSAAAHADPSEADALLGRVLGLSDVDFEVVTDALAVSLPTAPSEHRAQARPTGSEVDLYIAKVLSMMAPMLAYRGRVLRVLPRPECLDEAWRVVVLTTRADEAPDTLDPTLDDAHRAAMRHAAEQGASRVVMAAPTANAAVVGVFAQYRYWTVSQARALALDLLHDEHVMRALRGEA